MIFLFCTIIYLGDNMKRKMALFIVIIGTLGILFTLIFHVLDNPATPLASGLGIFKYFTILSNLIVVIYFWLLFSLKLDKSEVFNKWFGGVTVYITITGMVFVIILQNGFQQIGFDKIGSIICHYIMPILTVGFLIYYRKEYKFCFKDIFIWIAFPILYIIFVLIRGSITNDYIYPFFELNSLGIGLFSIYLLAIVTFFGILSTGLVYLTAQKK